MLTRLRFRNFKAWRDSGELRLAPLTLLFGANSAGKTSIPQLLLMLKQTAESPDRQRALQPGDSRTLVDLGSYGDVVHHHDTSQPIDIEFEWSLPRPLAVADPLTGSTYAGGRLRFAVSIGPDGRHQPRVRSLRYALLEGDRVVVDAAMVGRDAAGGYALE